jgi:hypothetical protein
MRQLSFGMLFAAVVCVGPALTAQQPAGPSGDSSAIDKVSLIGCVVKGTKGGYLLKDVIASSSEPVAQPTVVGTSGATTATAPILYWLDDNDDLDDHVGHTILITGELKSKKVLKAEVAVERRDDGRIELDAKVEDTKVTARLPEAPDAVVAAMLPNTSVPVAVGTSGTVSSSDTAAVTSKIGDKEIDLPFNARRVDVKSVTRVEKGCR